MRVFLVIHVYQVANQAAEESLSLDICSSDERQRIPTLDFL